MRIDEKIGTEYETEGVSHSRARGSLPAQQDCCPECLVSLLDFDAADGSSCYWICLVIPHSLFPIPQFFNSPRHE